MTGFLLCIGCDAYEHLQPLNGAEQDATGMFHALTTGPGAVFSPERARLLLSPSLQQLRDTLSEAQDRLANVASLLLFFAGHGGLAHGSYYLATSDTQLNKMSTTAFGLTHLFEFLNETQIGHCNIIIDACGAGGMVTDIGALLKPDIIGKARTAGVSIFVSAASDQYAGEVPEGGIGTAALLRVIRGEVDTGSRSSQLDLLDIGRAAAQEVNQQTGGEQSPSVWGMNLYGAAAICGNPHAGIGAPSILGTTGLSPESEAGQLISASLPKIWQLFFAAPDSQTPARIVETFRDLVRQLSAIPHAAPLFIEGIGKTLLDGAGSKTHSFAPVEITASCLALILPNLTRDAYLSPLCLSLGATLMAQVSDACDDTIAVLADPGGLCPYGPPDLYYLPQRIARVLGWSGAAGLIGIWLDLDGTTALAEKLATLEAKLIEEYGGHFCGISEEEAPYWMVYLIARYANGETEPGEQVLGLLWHALLDSQGAFARTGLPPGEAFEYLRLRAVGDPKAKSFCANPSEALAMVLLLAQRFGLGELFDTDMEQLDHAHAGLFLPADHTGFSDAVMRQGRTHVFQIGHGVWNLQDLRARWDEACEPQLQEDPSLLRLDVRLAAMCTSLVFPNRLPWFLLAKGAGLIAPNQTGDLLPPSVV